ncbi:hypothetical protein LZ30DRAFT_784598 [Colletotrichum cereale]|nr:hypothetical protein LZ30DRAFT_784598 [Colletotrichum cereale]
MPGGQSGKPNLIAGEAVPGARQPPMYRPEMMRNLPILNDELKAGYERGLRQLWNHHDSHPEESAQHENAKKKIQDFTKMLINKQQGRQPQRHMQQQQPQQQPQQRQSQLQQGAMQAGNGIPNQQQLYQPDMPGGISPIPAHLIQVTPIEIMNARKLNPKVANLTDGQLKIFITQIKLRQMAAAREKMAMHQAQAQNDDPKATNVVRSDYALPLLIDDYDDEKDSPETQGMNILRIMDPITTPKWMRTAQPCSRSLA